MKKMYLNNNKKMYLGSKRHSIYNKKKRHISPFIVCIVLAVILLLGAIIYFAVDSHNKKSLVKSYLNNARSYTETQNYVSAIDEYNKALKIGGGNSKPDIYRNIVDCYIKSGQTEEAINYTRLLIQKREINDDTFSSIAFMINTVDQPSAYRLLESYLETNKGDSPSIQQLVTYAASAPVIPQLDMLQGSYVKLSDVKFKSADEQFGHSIYYTTEKDAPDSNSNKSKIYRGGFSIDKSTEIRAVSYNSSGEASEIALFSFNVDTEMLTQLQELTSTARSLHDMTEIGTDAGQCSEIAKKRFNKVITEAEQLLKNDNILYMDAENNVAYLQAAIDEFNTRTNKDVDSAALDSLISNAMSIYDAVSASATAADVSEQLSALESSLYNASLGSADQESISKAYHTVYQDLLALNLANCKSAYKALLVNDGSSNYIIYDINDDMIPELIINSGVGTQNTLYTYAVSLGKAVKVDNVENFSSIARFYNSHDGLLGCTTEDGTGDFYMITFAGNNLAVSDKLEQYSTNETLRTSLDPVEVNASGSTQAIDSF